MVIRRCLVPLVLVLMWALVACGGGGKSGLTGELNAASLAEGGALNTEVSTENVDKDLVPATEADSDFSSGIDFSKNGQVLPDAVGLPSVPSEDPLTEADLADASARSVSFGATGSKVVLGGNFVAMHNGQVEEGQSLLLRGGAVTRANGQGQVDWAVYRVDAIAGSRPTKLTVNASPSKSGSSYYIALANYSTNSWDWFGPSVANKLEVDLSGNYSSYVSWHGNLFFMMMTPPTKEVRHVNSYLDYEYAAAGSSIPAVPAGVVATNGEETVETDGVDISWAPAKDAETYEILRNEVIPVTVKNYTEAEARAVGHGNNNNNNCKPRIDCTFYGSYCRVTCSKAISNCVLRFEDGKTQKFDNLKGNSGSFKGEGEHKNKTIVGCWIKSGCNGSGDGPGYGEYCQARYTSNEPKVCGKTSDCKYRDNSCEQGKIYCYRVRSCNKKGKSSCSKSKCGKPKDCEITGDKCPCDLVAGDCTTDEGVTITFSPGAGSYTTFELYRKPKDGGDWTKVADTISTTYVDTTAQCGVDYKYKVTKVCGSKTCDSNTDVGNWCCGDPCPKALTASDCETGTITVTWDPGDQVGKFDVYRYRQADKTTVKLATNVTGTTYVDSTMKCGEKYDYWVVKWYKGKDCKSNSDWGMATCEDFCPSDLTASEDEEGSIHISFNPGSGAGALELYRRLKNDTNFTKIADLTNPDYIDDTATCDVVYTYQVKKTAAFCGEPCYTNKDDGKWECKDFCPTELNATDFEADGVHLSWNPGSTPGGEWTFKIYRIADGSQNLPIDQWTLLGTTQDSQWIDDTAECNVKYYYHVFKWTKTRTCVAECTSGKRKCEEFCPTDVVATDDREDGVKISWTPGDLPSTDYAYTVYRFDDAAFTQSTRVQIYMGKGTSTVDTTAVCNKDYWYVIKFWQPHNDLTCAYDKGRRVCCDFCPTGLSATQGSHTKKVKLSWDCGCGDGCYFIYRKPTAYGTYQLVGSVGVGVCEYTDQVCGCNIRYDYKIVKIHEEEACETNVAKGWPKV